MRARVYFEQNGSVESLEKEIRRIEPKSYTKQKHKILQGVTFRGEIKFQSPIAVYYKNGKWCTFSTLQQFYKEQQNDQ